MTDDLAVPPDQLVVELTERWVQTGLFEAEDLQCFAEQFFRDDDLSDEAVATAVQAALQAQAAREAGWDTPTEAERLLAVLASLNVLVVPGVARHGWPDEIEEDLEEAVEEAGPVRGVVYWTLEHALAAVAGHGLTLQVVGRSESEQAVTTEVVKALARERFPHDGLTVRLPWRTKVPVY